MKYICYTWIYCLYILCWGSDISNGSVNLAFEHPAIQSSNYTGGIYGPERAVDNNTLGTFGVPGQVGTGTCCHTQVFTFGWTPVYWQVDLGNISIITGVSVTYRSDQLSRFNGYIIKVSNQSLTGGSVCFQDTAPGNPPSVVEHQCIVIGRYARYENTVGYAELCNFEVYGCPVNFYGNNSCSLACPENCLFPPCNPDNGYCIGGCMPGWKGDQCDKECDNGTYGSACAQQCFCRNVFCDKITGLCPAGCERGWSGSSCNQPCTTGKFGYDCLSQCNCAGSYDCNAVNGTCNSGVCLPGWTLHSCSQVCPGTTFGGNCSSKCGFCHDGMTCNHVTGICDNGCSNGWIGTYCNISCDPGMYGLNCSKKCGSCFNNTKCNNVDGHCSSERCEYGFRGKNCDQECLPDTYGRNCEESCGRCFNGSCSIINGTCLQGCASGFGDSLCKTSLLTQGSPVSSAVTPVVVTILLIAVIAGVGLFFLRRRQKATKNTIKYKKKDAEVNNQSYLDVSILRKSTDSIYANSSKKTDVNGEVSPENKASSSDNVHEDAIYSNDTEEDICTNTLILVKDLEDAIANKRGTILENEYNQLPVGLQFPHEHGKNPANKAKNRFLSTFPYDKNRVILPAVKGVENSDYINASYINIGPCLRLSVESDRLPGIWDLLMQHGIDKEKAYIATQGPKKGTIVDFWRMIWKENVKKVVMVTNLVEGAKPKCEQYWPNKDDQMVSGPLVITNKKQIKYAAFVTRELEVTSKKSEKVMVVHQYHFTQWPDHGTPDALQLVHFNSRVELPENTGVEPLLVHCSAGIGRTGTFIALHELTKHGRKTGSIDIFQYAKLMRRGRMNMIQTFDQYTFLHDALLEALTNQRTCYLREEFSDKLLSLQNDKPKNETELWKQYEHLKFVKPVIDESCYSDALSEKNKPKNRNVGILPHNRYRTILMTYPSEGSDYINAVTIPSYKELSGFITTQIPLPGTVDDFWCMVYDHDCSCIIILDCVTDNVTIAPPVNEFMWLKSVFVYNEREFPISEFITDFDILLSPQDVDKEKERKIKLFTNNSDHTDKLNKTTEVLVTLCECVIEYQKSVSETGPIVLVCSDGASKCGMFAAMTTTIQRILIDKDLDIFQTVKTIQKRQPHYVNTFEQYEYLHKLVDDFMDSNQLYVNV